MLTMALKKRELIAMSTRAAISQGWCLPDFRRCDATKRYS